MNVSRTFGVGVISAVSLLGGYWLAFSSYSQWAGRFPFHGPTGERRIALTFDDGPNEPYTSELADLLEENGIRGTFFQVGVCAERHPETVARLAAAGHVIGNHSWSHRMSWCVGRGRQASETGRTQRLLTELLGRSPALYRPPWLLRTRSLFTVLRSEGLQAVSGEFGHAFEFVQPSARRMARRAIAKAKPGAILIFHDGFDGRGGFRGETVEAVRQVLPVLIDRGYEFVTVDELLGVPAYQPAAARS
jgi:peptidoglycan-N-acetylglucosamine deacetylase